MDVNELVQSAQKPSTWWLGGCAIYGDIVGTDRKTTRVRVAADDYGQQYPDLFPAVAAYMERIARRTGSPTVTGAQLLPTILFHTQALRFATELNEPLFYNKVTLVLPYRTDEGKAWRMWIDGEQLRMDDVYVDSRKILFVEQVRQQGAFLSLTDLNARYPGWEERWTIGTDLGLPQEDIVTQMFPKTSALTPSTSALSDITFE